MDSNIGSLLFVAWLCVVGAAMVVAWVAVSVLSWLQSRANRRYQQRLQVARERALVLPIRGFNPARDERGRYVRDGVPSGLKPWMARNHGR